MSVPLCRIEEIPDRTGKGFTVTRDGKELEILVVRAGVRAYGYVNCCPHYGITLEWMRDTGYQDPRYRALAEALRKAAQ